MHFLIKIMNYFKNGFKLLKEKLGTKPIQPYLYYHFEPSCFVVRPGQFWFRLYDNSVPKISLPFLHTTKKSREREKLPMKRVYVSPQKSCESSPSEFAKVVGSEHSYAITTDSAHSEVKQLKNKVKVLKQKIQQQKRKIENMEELMKSLKDKQLVSCQQHKLLRHNFAGVSKCLFENQMENSQFKDITVPQSI